MKITKNEDMNNSTTTPILFPYSQEEFWEHIRSIIREEISKIKKEKPSTPVSDTPGLTYYPLFKIADVCNVFRVTRPTIYEWIKDGKLKPYKIRRRVYFLWQDIQQLLPIS
ncbi:helix-turn-helix domain-containing protein [Segetibacter koreensis]|uniref:helix-turn-helix domain-containing protein n=1 Tax=Segetibacter koreensis TaxID=398037 RepID=UPI000364AB77|nr:helix-turn-helix domain-containing protein [Segetibacter koreensis]